MSDMTIQNAIHCMKAMICEEVCEECDYYGKTGTDHCEADAIRMAIKALEEQSRWKKGKWIKISPANIYECSECCKNVMTDDISAYDFCHGCGADMRGENDEL